MTLFANRQFFVLGFWSRVYYRMLRGENSNWEIEMEIGKPTPLQIHTVSMKGQILHRFRNSQLCDEVDILVFFPFRFVFPRNYEDHKSGWPTDICRRKIFLRCIFEMSFSRNCHSFLFQKQSMRLRAGFALSPLWIVSRKSLAVALFELAWRGFTCVKKTGVMRENSEDERRTSLEVSMRERWDRQPTSVQKKIDQLHI